MLGLTAISFMLGGVRAMLWLSRCCRLVFLQLFEDVFWHGDVESACIAILSRAYAVVEVTVPIHGELIFFFDALDQVFYVFLMHVFYAKVSTTRANEMEWVACFHRPGV